MFQLAILPISPGAIGFGRDTALEIACFLAYSQLAGIARGLNSLEGTCSMAIEIFLDRGLEHREC